MSDFNLGVFTVIFMPAVSRKFVTPLQNQTTELKITKSSLVPIKLQSTGPPCPGLP